MGMRPGALALALCSRWPGCPSGVGPPCSGVPTLPVLTTCAPAAASRCGPCISHQAQARRSRGGRDHRCQGRVLISDLASAHTHSRVRLGPRGTSDRLWVSPSWAPVARALSGHPRPGRLAQHARSPLGPSVSLPGKNWEPGVPLSLGVSPSSNPGPCWCEVVL